MTFTVAALLAFVALFVLDRLATLPWFVRLATAVAAAVLVSWAYDGTIPHEAALRAVAAGAAGLILSDLVAILQAATDALRVRVISAATRRGGRIPPL